MGDRTTMTGTGTAPGAVLRFIDQRAIPAAIDAAGTVELALNQVAIRARRRPLTALSLALGGGGLIGALLWRPLLGRRQA